MGAHRPVRRHPRRGGDGLRARPRRALAAAPVRAGLPVRAVLGAVLVPAGDDRRGGEDAAAPRRPGPGRPGPAAPDQPRPRDLLDLGPVDDRTHRRLRRRACRRPPPSRTARTWRLHGTKWFTSAITSQMALTLARPEDNGPGGKGLAMYYLEVRDEAGRLNNIRVLRLKDKLGTRQMPTAELALDGTVAHLVGEPANGTRNITPMLTVTRLWNSRDGRRRAASGRRPDHRLRPPPRGLRPPARRPAPAPGHAGPAARAARGVDGHRVPRGRAARPRGGRHDHRTRGPRAAAAAAGHQAADRQAGGRRGVGGARGLRRRRVHRGHRAAGPAA